MAGRDRRELLPWMFGAALSLGLHGVLLYQADTPLGIDERDEPARTQTTRVSFRSVAAPEPQPAPAVPVPEPRPEPPREVETPAPQEPPPPARREAQNLQPQSQVVQQVGPPESVPRTEPQPPQPTTTASAAAEESRALNAADTAERAQAKRHYLALLLAHIERHKFYPRAARRRGLEGEVEIRLTLMAGGQIGGLEASGAHPLLRQSALDAVQAAQPLPLPPEGLGLPLALEFSIHYSLH